jgi:hypothetical protein
MTGSETPRLQKLRNLLFAGLCFWFFIVVVGVNVHTARLQAMSPPDYPFGIISVKGELFTQDYSYNMLFFRGIRDRLVPHPYRMKDQEVLMRQLAPMAYTGMSHAYSPVALVLALPLLLLSPQGSFLVYSILSAAATLLLFRFYLFPRATEPMQLVALTLCAVSLWGACTLFVGQTPPITTALLAALWVLLIGRSTSPSILRDVVIAALFWGICLKPSVGLVPFMLLLGMKAWRPLILGLFFLLVTWASLAGHYGGFFAGLSDYSYMLNHYNYDELSPFLRRPEGAAYAGHASSYFLIWRALIMICSLTFLTLRWTGRITDSELFQGMLWNFLLFSPYLMPSENWVLWLLLVEGTFFQLRPSISSCLKLLLLVLIFNLREHVTIPITAAEWYLKCLLGAWILIDAIRRRDWNSDSDRGYSLQSS